MVVFVFTLWRHLWQTFKIGANFLCNSLLRNIEIKDPLYLSKFSSVFLKIGTKWERLWPDTRILNFGKILWRKVWKGFPSVTSLSQILESSFKVFKVISKSSVIFSKVLKFSNPCGFIKSKLGWKGGKFVYYIATVIKTSSSVPRIDIINPN